MKPTTTLDHKILHMLDQLDRAAPQPPPFDTLLPRQAPNQSRRVAAAAAAVGIAGLAGLVVINSRDARPILPTSTIDNTAQPAPATLTNSDPTDQSDPLAECRSLLEFLNTESTLTADQIQQTFDYLRSIESAPVDATTPSNAGPPTSESPCPLETPLTAAEIELVIEYVRDL